MKSKDGFVQAYNAQAAVDAGAQIIVAHELTQCGNDQGILLPTISCPMFCFPLPSSDAPSHGPAACERD